jgi:hypothetical protein
MFHNRLYFVSVVKGACPDSDDFRSDPLRFIFLGIGTDASIEIGKQGGVFRNKLSVSEKVCFVQRVGKLELAEKCSI